MAAGKLQSSMPVLISVQPCVSRPTSEDQSHSTTTEESMPFTRPSITTGAHLPWNVNKKAAYGAPRAICPLQTVPPITLLSNSKEATKLVYSKDSEKAASVGLSETPFRQRSQVTLSDEEPLEREKNIDSQNGALADGARLRDNEAIDGPRLDSVQASTGGLHAHTVDESGSHKAATQSPRQAYFMSQQMPPSETAYPGAQIKMEQSWVPNPVELPGAAAETYLCPPLDFSSIKSDAVPDSHAAESAGFAHKRRSSLYKASGESSQLQLLDTSPDEDETEPLDGNSRSQSLSEKRKCDAVEPKIGVEASDVQLLQEEISLTEQRAVRRRMTNRASAIRSAEKKSQELTRMEKTIEKFQNEQTELHAKLKRSGKTISELKYSLEATRHKLKAQENVNSKLKSEMQFLRGNLDMLPQSQATFEARANVEDSTKAPFTHQLSWTPEFPFPTGMPTNAEIAADLELDRQLLVDTDSGHEYLREWQMW